MALQYNYIHFLLNIVTPAPGTCFSFVKNRKYANSHDSKGRIRKTAEK